MGRWRGALSGVLVGAVALLVVPSLAQADLTFSSGATANVTETSTCVFTATAADAELNNGDAAVTDCEGPAGNLSIQQPIAGAGIILDEPVPSTQNVELQAAGDIAQDEPVTAENLSLTAGGEINQEAPITANVLTLQGATQSLLIDSDNAIDQLNDSGTGSLVLDDADSLTVDQVQAGSSGVGLYSNGAVTQTGGIAAGTLSAGGDSVTLNGLNSVSTFSAHASSGDVSFSNQGPLEIDSVSAGTANVNLTTTGALTQAADIDSSITAGTLTTSSGQGTELTNAANSFSTLSATNNSSGAMEFSDAMPLTVSGLDQAGSGGAVALTDDQLSLSGSSAIQAGSHSVTISPATVGRAVDLGTPSTPSQLGLTAAELGSIGASQLIMGGPNAGALTVSAPIALASIPSLALSGTGGLTASGSGSLSFSTLSLSSLASTPRSWTISPGSVGDGTGAPIPYSGVSTLDINGGSGGDTFGVTAAPSTTDSISGGPAANGTLNYDAQGRAVLGPAQPPNGRIDSSPAAPVYYSQMAAVHVSGNLVSLVATLGGNGAGSVTGPGGFACPGPCSASYLAGTTVTLTATPSARSTFFGWNSPVCSGTGSCTFTISADTSIAPSFETPPPSGGTAPPSGPRCTMRVLSSHILGRRKRLTKGSLTLAVTCNQAATGSISAFIAEAPAPARHRKVRPLTLILRPVKVSLANTKPAKVTVQIPRSAVTALAHGARESAVFRLRATNRNGIARATATVSRLRP